MNRRTAKRWGIPCTGCVPCQWTEEPIAPPNFAVQRAGARAAHPGKAVKPTYSRLSTVVALLLLATPLPATAPQTARVAVIGLLESGSPGSNPELHEGLRQGLRELAAAGRSGH